jgi:hypothetical protein
MSVIVLQVFVSLLLVAGSLVMFLTSVRQKDPEHADRLSLTPLEEDSPCKAQPPCTPDESNTTTP